MQYLLSKTFIFALLLIPFSLLGQSSINLTGIWKRMTPNGLLSFEFKTDGSIQVDMGDDGSVVVISQYKIENDTIYFSDNEGKTCPDEALYKVTQTDYYVSFDLIKDNCNARVKSTMGFWTKSNVPQMLLDLEAKLYQNPNDVRINLSRARLFMALGKPTMARPDLDMYLEQFPNDARALVNRAGTRFPMELQGVIYDCTTALRIDSRNKNAWFLRGLAKYELGQEAEGCADFDAAIGYGFEVLRLAEEYRCAIYWKKE